MGTRILKGKKMRDQIVSGISKLHECVSGTMGPSGRNVIIRGNFDQFSITNDGYQCVENFNLEDEVENLGCGLIKEASKRSNNESGDGTSSTIAFCWNFLRDGCEIMDKGCNGQDLREGMKIAGREFVKELDRMTSRVGSIEEIVRIATISGNNDKELGELIGEIYKAIGLSGVINFEKIEGNGIIKEIKKGYLIDKGYSNSVYVNNNVKGICEWSGDCLVWIGDASNYENCLDVLEFCIKEQRGLLIISDECDERLISIYKANKTPMSKSSGKELKLCVIRSPSNDIFRRELLEDIGIYCGVQPAMNGLMGACNGFRSSMKETLIINGAGEQIAIDNQIMKIKETFDFTKPQFYKDSLDKRVNRLVGKLCELKIGSKTHLERSELIDRIEDIIRATKAGIDSGYFIGGGYTLLKIQKHLRKELKSSNPDQQKGIDLVVDNLDCLLKQNLKNAGLDIWPNPKFGAMVYNIKTRKWERPEVSNVLEVNLVMKSAIENAISLVATILLADNLIY